VAVVLGGCGTAKPAPVSALHKYSEALRGGDYDKAYAMMSEEFRETHSKDEFVRVMKENKAEVRETAHRLDSGHRGMEVSASFRYGAGDSLDLVLENGEWKIASNPVVFYSQASPRDALRSFVRAYKLERWDVMLRLIPSEYAAKMDVEKVKLQFLGPRRDEIELMMNSIEGHIDAPIQTKGTDARMAYGDTEVVFVREDGVWKIKDPG